jgi:hypothetical protein
VTANPHERAVIEAAKAYGLDDGADRHNALIGALDALATYEATLTPGVKEIDWHEVTEGDELQGSDGTTFRPVLKTLKARGGRYEITVKLNTGPKTLVRPTKEAPSATVRRGAAGQAVDVFVNVFSSGGR